MDPDDHSSSLHPLSRQKVNHNYGVMIQHLEIIEEHFNEIFDEHPTLLESHRETLSSAIGYAQLFVLGQQKKLAECLSPPPPPSNASSFTDAEADDENDDDSVLSYESQLSCQSDKDNTHQVPENVEPVSGTNYNCISDQEVPHNSDEERSEI